MIYGRSKWLNAALALVARDAARRFVRGKSLRGRSSSWSPLVMEWRRRRNHREHLPTSHAAIGPRVFSFPQFHFHFATQQSNRMGRDRTIALVHGPEVFETRVVVDRYWTNIQTGGLTAPASRADRTLRQFHSPQNSRTTGPAALINTPRSLRTGRPSIQTLQANHAYPASHPFCSTRIFRHPSEAGVTNPLRSFRTSRHSILAPAGSGVRWSGKIPDLARANKPSEERILFVNHSHTWQHWLQIFGRRPPAPGDLFSSSRKETKPQSVQFDSREELVWRRSRHESTDVAYPEGRQEFFNSYEQPALRSFQSQEAAPMPARFEPPATLQITKLDPALVDRLTDDVIRRVEQRVRIERERRGL